METAKSRGYIAFMVHDLVGLGTDLRKRLKVMRSRLGYTKPIAALVVGIVSNNVSYAQEALHLSLPKNKTSNQASANPEISGKMLAKISDNIRGCSEAPSASDRLHCYDMVAQATQIVPGANGTTGAWVTSPGAAALASSSTTTAKDAPHPGLFVKCRQESIFAYVEFGENPFPHSNHDGYRHIKVSLNERRLDGGSAKSSVVWTSSSAKSAIGVWTTDEAMIFADHLRRDKTITMTMEPLPSPPATINQEGKEKEQELVPVAAGSERIAINFFTEGSEGALTPILASCRLKGKKQS